MQVIESVKMTMQDERIPKVFFKVDNNFSLPYQIDLRKCIEFI